MRVLIVDDEAPARSRLKSLLKPFVAKGTMEVKGEASDGVEAIELLRSEDSFDVVFLDVEMPGATGFDVLEQIAVEKRPVVIFMTAYDEYAVRAFEANATDYLLKPISKERLEVSVERAQRLLRDPKARQSEDERVEGLIDWVDESATPPPDTAAPEQYLTQLSVPYRDRILVLPVEKLIAAEVHEGMTRLVFEPDTERRSDGPRTYMVNHTLEQLERRLSPERFMRVHRSAIVGMPHIKEMIAWFSGRFKLRLTGDHEVVASRERSKKLRKRLSL